MILITLPNTEIIMQVQYEQLRFYMTYVIVLTSIVNKVIAFSVVANQRLYEAIFSSLFTEKKIHEKLGTCIVTKMY